MQALGGRVEAKVPRQGFILIRPHTGEAERLLLCWDSPDRPERHFVPYTYVEACKIAGMLLKQIFVENGEPIKFHIDSSIANINARAALSARIMVGHIIVYVIQTRLISGLVALWRRSQCICSNGTCHSRRPEYRDFSASGEELSGCSRKIRRIVFMGQEVYRKGNGSIHTPRVQEPWWQTPGRRVRCVHISIL